MVSSIVGGRCVLCVCLWCLFVYMCTKCVIVMFACCLLNVQAKYEFRNFINTKTTKRESQVANILIALGRDEYQVRYSKKIRPAPLPLFHARRFDRKCRDFERAYMCYKTPRSLHRATVKGSGSGYMIIQKIIQKVKAHRCTGSLQSRVCMDDGPSSWLAQLQI